MLEALGEPSSGRAGRSRVLTAISAHAGMNGAEQHCAGGFALLPHLLLSSILPFLLAGFSASAERTKNALPQLV